MASLLKFRVKVGILLGQASHLERVPLSLGVSPLLMKWDTNLGEGVHLSAHAVQLKDESCKDLGQRRPGGRLGRKDGNICGLKAT